MEQKIDLKPMIDEAVRNVLTEDYIRELIRPMLKQMDVPNTIDHYMEGGRK